MIVQEIPILPQPFTTNIINVTLNEQQCQITLDTINNIDEYSLTPKSCYTSFNMNVDGVKVTRGMFCRARADLVFKKVIFPDYVFFYSPNTTQNPMFPMFGTSYKLIYSDTFAFNEDHEDHEEFINELNRLFKR